MGENKIQHRLRNWTTETSSLFTFLFFTSGVTTNGIYSTRLCRYISSCPRPIRHLFLCSLGQLLNLHKRPLGLVNLRNQMNSNLWPLFSFHIQYATRCLFERWRRQSGSWLLVLRKIQHQGVGEGASLFSGLLHFILDTYFIIPYKC